MFLQGKGAVVTGGGRGIGSAVAREIVGEGGRVVVAARSGDELRAVARELGKGVRAVTCDVTDPEEVANLYREAREHLGHIDILINNAGIAKSAPLRSLRLEDWNRMMAVNATGTFLCTQAFLEPMVEAGWGRIVNVASVAGKAGAAYISAYAASKHAVIGFTRSIADEVATSGVTVNAVCPGFVDTEMAQGAIRRIVSKTGIDEADARHELEAMSPQKRIFSVEEVAYLVLSLCHPRAAGINGQALVLDGGRLQS